MEQGLRQGCVLASLLFSIFFAAIINVAYTRFKADRDIIDALVQLREKRGHEGGGGEQLSESRFWRHRHGTCFTLTMQESSRNRPSS